MMGPSEWAVLLGGIAAIAVDQLVLLPGRSGARRRRRGRAGVQEVRVAVEGGYSPGHDAREAGRAGAAGLRPAGDARAARRRWCSRSSGSKRFLPAHEETAVEFTPRKAGTYEFTCGMSMLRGKIVVE